MIVKAKIQSLIKNETNNLKRVIRFERQTLHNWCSESWYLSTEADTGDIERLNWFESG